MDMQALLFVKLTERRAGQSDLKTEDAFYNAVIEVPWLIRVTWAATLALIAWGRVIFARRRPHRKQEATTG